MTKKVYIVAERLRDVAHFAWRNKIAPDNVVDLVHAFGHPGALNVTLYCVGHLGRELDLMVANMVAVRGCTRVDVTEPDVVVDIK